MKQAKTAIHREITVAIPALNMRKVRYITFRLYPSIARNNLKLGYRALGSRGQISQISSSDFMDFRFVDFQLIVDALPVVGGVDVLVALGIAGDNVVAGFVSEGMVGAGLVILDYGFVELTVAEGFGASVVVIRVRNRGEKKEEAGQVVPWERTDTTEVIDSVRRSYRS
jgi:hypothetical protein